MFLKALLVLIILSMVPITLSSTIPAARKNSTTKSVTSTRRPIPNTKVAKLAKLRVTTSKPIKRSASISISTSTTVTPQTTFESTTMSKELNVTLILMSDAPINRTSQNVSLDDLTIWSVNKSEIEREDEGMESEAAFSMREEGKSVQNFTTKPPETTTIMNANATEEESRLIGLQEQCFIEGDLSCESRVDLVCFGFGYIDCAHNGTSSSSLSIVTRRDERSASLIKDSLVRNEDEKDCKLSQRTLKCDPWPSKVHCMGRGYCKPNEVTNEDITNDTNFDEHQVSSPFNLVAFITVALAFFILIGASSSYYFTKRSKPKVGPMQNQEGSHFKIVRGRKSNHDENEQHKQA